MHMNNSVCLCQIRVGDVVVDAEVLAVTQNTTIVLPVGAVNPVTFDNSDMREVCFILDTLSGAVQSIKPDTGFILCAIAHNEVLH